MLVILASRSDPAASALAARWATREVKLMTCADLSRAGWYAHVGADADSTTVVGGSPVPTASIQGVLVRLAAVSEVELAHIRSEDRAYVAAEMTAFLKWWLWSLPCPVLNRPTAAGLGGPYWRQEQWVRTATALGIPARPVRRHVVLNGEPTPPEPTVPTTVTVIGGRCLGADSRVLQDRATRLAAACNASLLAVQFDAPGPEGRLVEADPWVNLWDPSVADALFEFFEEHSAC